MRNLNNFSVYNMEVGDVIELRRRVAVKIEVSCSAPVGYNPSSAEETSAVERTITDWVQNVLIDDKADVRVRRV